MKEKMETLKGMDVMFDEAARKGTIKVYEERTGRSFQIIFIPPIVESN